MKKFTQIAWIGGWIIIGFGFGQMYQSRADEPKPLLASEHFDVLAPTLPPIPKKKPLRAEDLLNFHTNLRAHKYTANLSSVCTITFAPGSTVITGTQGCTFERGHHVH